MSPSLLDPSELDYSERKQPHLDRFGHFLDTYDIYIYILYYIYIIYYIYILYIYILYACFFPMTSHEMMVFHVMVFHYPVTIHSDTSILDPKKAPTFLGGSCHWIHSDIP